MEFLNTFVIDAPPALVYSVLTDPPRVVGCLPGAQLLESKPDGSFVGSITIKMGPVTVSYQGNGRINESDEVGRVAVLTGQGRETRGAGTVKATARLEVVQEQSATRVNIRTEVAVTGKAAQFGRGVLTEISKSLVNQLAENLVSVITAADAASGAPGGKVAPEAGADVAAASGGQDRSEGRGDAAAVVPLNLAALVRSAVKARVSALVKGWRAAARHRRSAARRSR
jgi:carbon monoxide dehydrogenase subunit G